jgi:hypothetical protein
LLLALAAGCQRPAGEGQGPGGRPQWLGLNPAQESALGVHADREILAKSEVVRSGPEVDQVERVGRRIAHAAENPDLLREINLHEAGYRFDWEFHVLRDRQVNAFCLPGGTRYTTYAVHAGPTGPVNFENSQVKVQDLDNPMKLVLILLVIGVVAGIATAYIGLMFHHHCRHHEMLHLHGQHSRVPPRATV